jgi:hypothetical protein
VARRGRRERKGGHEREEKGGERAGREGRKRVSNIILQTLSGTIRRFIASDQPADSIGKSSSVYG